MRLSATQCEAIRAIVNNSLGPTARVRLFGSRLDDSAKGGDVDLLVELDVPVEAPATLAAKLSVQFMRALGGCKVDVLVAAPNLAELPIHRIAREQGVLL
jgi:predicted nucleotidyltransferase